MKKIYLTGIKPTGIPHIGNYFGAIKPAIEFSKNNEFDFFYFIADYHALNSIKDKQQISQYIFEVACTWLACGLNPNKVTFYKQSSVSQIFEITLLLANVTAKGLMNRAHAYKAAVDEARNNNMDDDALVNMGLFNYPILMAADILSMNANFVPVGEDQKQHIEITRDIANSFNKTYGKCLVVPTEIINKDAATVLGLDGRKMSKSYNNTIPLFVAEDKLKKLVMSIKTDSTLPEEPKDKNSTVFKYYKLFATPEQLQEYEKQFDKGISWAEAKTQLFELMNNTLKPMREKYEYYKQNPSIVKQILADGAVSANAIASQTLERMRQAVGVEL
jgi:tryptophanyl-tRNA synthetase